MEFYVGKNSRVFGPYELNEIQRRMDEGRIDGSELVWHRRRTEWGPFASDEIFQTDKDSREYLVTLLELREQLHHQIGDLRKDAAEETEAHSMHMADSGSDAFDRDLVLSTISADQDMLYEIDEAINRIEYNKYGICEISGKQIPNDRLDALPWARFTVETQSRLENGGNLPQRKLGQLKNLVGTAPKDNPSELILEEEGKTTNPDSNNGNFMEEETTKNPSEIVSNSDLKDKLGRMLTSLTENERKVIELRFGLKDGERRTLDEIGKEFGVTRQRIQQIESKALERLRHPAQLQQVTELHKSRGVSMVQKPKPTGESPEASERDPEVSSTFSTIGEEPKIWIHINDEQRGPYPSAEVKQFLADGLLEGTELAWHEGLDGWTGLSILFGIEVPNERKPVEVEAMDSTSGNEPGIWILRGDDQFGPYPLEQVRQSLIDGQLDGSELAWHKGLEAWRNLFNILSELDATETKSAAYN